jgi:exopolysaccharide production protein ExoQ
MKEILLNPIFLMPILMIGLIYLGISYTLISRNPKLAFKAEKVLIFVFILVMAGFNWGLFERLHPLASAVHGTTLAARIGQLAIYGAILFIFFPRLSNTLKDSLQVLVITLIENPFLYLLFLMMSLSMFWSEIPILTLRHTLVLLGITTVAAYIAKQYNWVELCGFIKWATALQAILSLIDRDPQGKGWTGIYGHANGHGSHMGLSVALWAWYAVNYPKQRWFAVIIAAISLLLVEKTNSAGAKVQIFVYFSFLIYLQVVKKLPPKWQFVAVVLFIILFSIATILITENLETIVVDVLGKDMTFTGRRPMWELLWETKIKSHLWLGYGYYSFWQPWRGISDSGLVIMPNGYKVPNAHNGFMEILLDIGMIGLIFFLLAYLKTIATAIRYMNQSNQRESVLPFLFLMYLIMPALTNNRIIDFSDFWCYYIFVVVRLSIDLHQMSVSSKEQSKMLDQSVIPKLRD